MPMFSVAKRTLLHVDAFSLASLRYGIGVVLLVMLLGVTEGWRTLRFDGRLVPATVLGLTGITGFNLFLWLGLLYTLPEHASIIMQMQTPLTALAVWLARDQRPAAFTLACVALAIGGALTVVTKGEPFGAIAAMGRGSALFGDLLVFLAALSWVIYTMASGAFAGWSPLRMTVLTCIPGTLGLLLANAIVVAAGWVTIPALGTVVAVGWQILYLGVCSVALGVLGFNAAARHLGPLNTMLMLNVVPVGVFGIEAALGRSFSLIELAGAALVIGALISNNLYLRGASTKR
jgi:drug/metabolite transporter (DMT)-like permease